MTARIKVAVLVGTLLVLTPRALAQPVEVTPVVEVIPMPTTHLWMRSGDGVLRGPDGKDYLIPKDSHILTNERWIENDSEFLRLQEAETRLAAENQSLRKTADSIPWLPLAIAAGVGLVTGVYLGVKF